MPCGVSSPSYSIAAPNSIHFERSTFSICWCWCVSLVELSIEEYFYRQRSVHVNRLNMLLPFRAACSDVWFAFGSLLDEKCEREKISSLSTMVDCRRILLQDCFFLISAAAVISISSHFFRPSIYHLGEWTTMYLPQCHSCSSTDVSISWMQYVQ